MKVVVTGPSGFIGRALCAALVARGDQVLPLSKRGGIDLEVPGAWAESLVGADAVVHLAGEPIGDRRWTARQKQLLRDSRIETAHHLVDAIASASPRPAVLVSASGVDYYPFASEPLDDDDVTEANPPGDSFLARLCRDWEAAAHRAEASGVRVVCMRTALVLGPGGGVLAKLRGPVARLGSGRQWMSWIHLDDAIAAYVAAIGDTRYRGPINLVTESLRNKEFARALGKPGWLGAPAFALKLVVGELSESLLGGRRVIPAKLRELGFAWRYPTLAAALEAVTRARTSVPAG